MQHNPGERELLVEGIQRPWLREDVDLNGVYSSWKDQPLKRHNSTVGSTEVWAKEQKFISSRWNEESFGQPSSVMSQLASPDPHKQNNYED